VTADGDDDDDNGGHSLLSPTNVFTKDRRRRALAGVKASCTYGHMQQWIDTRSHKGCLGGAGAGETLVRACCKDDHTTMLLLMIFNYV
jgi:hypothetical protein